MRVTTAITKGKFPALSSALKESVLSKYIPSEKAFFYSRYYRECTISWHDREKGIVEIEEYVEIDVETSQSPQDVQYTYSNDSSSEVQKSDGFFKLETLRINDRPCLDCLKESPYTDTYGQQGTRHSYSIALEPGKSHKVQRVTRKRQCVRAEPYIEYSSQNFILNTTVKMRSTTEDLVPIFVSVGTDDFDNRAVSATVWAVHREFAKLMFPNQGYIMLMQQHIE